MDRFSSAQKDHTQIMNDNMNRNKTKAGSVN